jgi:hypothetical protein
VDPKLGRITMRSGDEVTVVFGIEMSPDGIVGKVTIEDVKVTYRIVSIKP